MRQSWLLAAFLIASAIPAAAATPEQKAPPTEDITVVGQRPVEPVTPTTSYWTEDAFTTYPLLGPNFAKGLIIWNHPEPGMFNGPSIPPIKAMEGLAELGWDITRLQRNGRLSNGWENKYATVRIELAHQIADARSQGYKRIILAGQEMGGGLALEAGKEIDGLYAVIALAPNSGIHWMGAPRMLTDIPTDGNWPSILHHTQDQMEHTKAERLMVFFPAADEEVPHERGPMAREILSRRGDIPFLLVDETSQVSGTAGADKADFGAYASCMDLFLSPDLTPHPGEFHCGADEVPLALAQMGAKPRGDDAWFGYGSNGQAIYLELPADRRSPITYGWGAGANGKIKPGTTPLTAKYAGDVFTAELAPDRVMRGVRRDGLWRITLDQEDGTRVAAVMHRLSGNS